MSCRVVAIIPARYASERFPGKPLADIAGVPMVVRVARQAALARRIGEVIVATDDRRIHDVVSSAGFRAVMSPAACPSGTDRVAFAAQELDPSPDLILNVQGDEPLLDPDDLDLLAEVTLASGAGIGTLARPLRGPSGPDAVKVVVGPGGRAIYFSRAPIPFGAELEGPEALYPLVHIGVYAYEPEILRAFVRLRPSRLERIERLEQLRAIEHGFPIHVVLSRSARPSIAVDRPEDVARVVDALEKSWS